jgi:hypothetical protein
MLLQSTGIERGASLCTVNLEGFGGKQIEGQCIFLFASQEEHVPPVLVPVPYLSSSEISQAKKDRHVKKEYLKQMQNWPRLYNISIWKTRNRESFFRFQEKITSTFFSSQPAARECPC